MAFIEVGNLSSFDGSTLGMRYDIQQSLFDISRFPLILFDSIGETFFKVTNKHLKNTKLYSIEFLRIEITSDPQPEIEIRAIRRVFSVIV